MTPERPVENVLIVGGGRVGNAVEKYINTAGSHQVIGYVDDHHDPTARPGWLGKASDIQKVFQNQPFDQMIITNGSARPGEIQDLIAFSENNGIRPSVVLDLPYLAQRNYELDELGGLTVVRFREVPLQNPARRLLKRTFDIIFSLAVLMLLAPLLLLIAAAIRIETKGPVFYRPLRVGRKGRAIRIFKFRSMIHQAGPISSGQSAQPDDIRVTRVGKFLRRYSLDELPQFLNVLEGSMSVVGPRPHRIELDKTFREIFPSYPVRRYVRPGITGWAQINGWRGLTEKKKDFKGRALHDLWYVEHWSFGLDLLIILLTVFGKKTHQNVF